ncbi:MAG: cation diffusion facilitator family transporter [Capsulimonadaceae bacterium]|nr:cation diffusion facilitator family transporter [Capsulimonadaceae bacterium]
MSANNEHLGGKHVHEASSLPILDHACADHGGHHHHNHSAQGPILWVSLIVTTLFVVFESAGGWYAHSLALLADAGHNFSDALALGLAAYAIWIARRPADARKTYGYHRVAILTALFNAATLMAIAIGILAEAVVRFQHPTQINTSVMIVVSIVAVLMNTVIASLLHGHSHDNLNVRAAYIHMAGDALSALSVLAAAILSRYMHWMQIDAAVSVLIGAFILWSSWGIVREATDVLLEGAPRNLDLDALISRLRAVEHVVNVHDIHVWSVSDGMNFMSCHVEVDNARTMDEIDGMLFAINTLLDEQFGISHATIQTERVGSCVSASPDDPLYCGDHITPAQAAAAPGALHHS